jgi:hypothetical protein
MVTSRDENAVQNINIKMDDKSFENVGQLKYLGRTLKYEHSFGGKIKSRLQSGNA